ncbi:hypothetical protein GF339_07925, partial [candidate division KSB3 bacterium]|nr:hypothetical protein [candidate division KSB3 bacterium]MBD3324497.1 hypothetical protein [candidate division KSB3 bacterium]
MNSTYRRYVLAVCGWWIAMSLGVLAEAGLVIDNTQISILGQTQMKQIFKNLDSINTLERRSAQLELTHYLENLEAAQRPSVIQDLIYAFPSTRYHIKLGICDALGSLNFFWEAADHEATIHFLYTEYLQEDDERLKKAMDNALMRAKGLYRDAINDYNTDQIGPSVEAKFTATFENYPKSSYAPMAHFYLGRYYTRAYLILQQREEQPTEKYLSTSNAVFQTLLDRLA